MAETALAILARYPEIGKVKTRLERSIGAETTLLLYMAFLHDLAQRFSDWNECDLFWVYTPQEADFAAYLSTFQEYATGYFAQQGESFNARLHHVFDTLSAQKNYSSVILIGSDAPHVSRACILEAKQALKTHDIVLGPAEDGGYYLLAMRQPHDLFSGIPMSTDVVLHMTIAKAHDLGLSVYQLETVSDVDELRDLLHLTTLLKQNPDLAPATAALLPLLIKDGL